MKSSSEDARTTPYLTQSKAPQPLDIDGDVDPRREQKAGGFNEA